MICLTCKSEIADNNVYCPFCGKRVKGTNPWEENMASHAVKEDIQWNDNVYHSKYQPGSMYAVPKASPRTEQNTRAQELENREIRRLVITLALSIMFLFVAIGSKWKVVSFGAAILSFVCAILLAGGRWMFKTAAVLLGVISLGYVLNVGKQVLATVEETSFAELFQFDKLAAQKESKPKIDKNFKKTIDNYEKMIDKYIKVLNDIKNNKGDLTLQKDSWSMWIEITKTAASLQKVDLDHLNEAEKKYYQDAMERIEKKLVREGISLTR